MKWLPSLPGIMMTGNTTEQSAHLFWFQLFRGINQPETGTNTKWAGRINSEDGAALLEEQVSWTWSVFVGCKVVASPIITRLTHRHHHHRVNQEFRSISAAESSFAIQMSCPSVAPCRWDWAETNSLLPHREPLTGWSAYSWAEHFSLLGRNYNHSSQVSGSNTPIPRYSGLDTPWHLVKEILI